MLKNGQEKLIYLTLWVSSFCSVNWAAPQGGPTLDLGVYKVSVDTNNGLAVRRDINIDLPFFKVKKTTEVGFGDPMVGNNGDSDSDSEESRKRRKKRELSEVSTNANVISSTHKRKKREPCYSYQMRPAQPGGGGTDGGDGGDGGDDGVDEEGRRRRSAMSKRNAKRKNKGSSKKRQKGRRRRRQVEVDIFEDETQIQTGGSKISQGINNALEKMNNAWNRVLQTTDKFIKDVKQTINNWRDGRRENPENVNPFNVAEDIK